MRSAKGLPELSWPDWFHRGEPTRDELFDAGRPLLDAPEPVAYCGVARVPHLGLGPPSPSLAT